MNINIKNMTFLNEQKISKLNSTTIEIEISHEEVKFITIFRFDHVNEHVE